MTSICDFEVFGREITMAEAQHFKLPKAERGTYTEIQWKRWLSTMSFFCSLYKIPKRHVRAVFDFDS